MGQERLAPGSRALLSDGGGVASGRGRATGVSWPSLDRVPREGLSAGPVRRKSLLRGVGRLGVGGGAVEGVAFLGGSDF